MKASRPLWKVVAVSVLLLAWGCASSRTPSDQMKIGLWASSQKLWEEAIFRWKRVLAENPGSAAAHNNLAVAYETKGLWDEARKEYEAALKLDPQNKLIKANFDQFKKNLEGELDAPPAPPKKDADEKKR